MGGHSGVVGGNVPQRQSVLCDFAEVMCSLALSCSGRVVMPTYESLHNWQVARYTTAAL